MDTAQFQAGLDRLAQPILPLIRLVQLLYLTGPFATVSEVVAELNEPIDTVVRYEEPAKSLAPFLDLMAEFQRIRDPGPANYTILNQDLSPLSLMEAIDLWVAQQVVTRELEAINSLLCGPCGCALCCTGPGPNRQHVFFEIPLAAAETPLFSLPKIESPTTRELTAGSEPPLVIDGQAFHDRGPALYHWETGWSMILPRNSACPHLLASRACAIYPRRPQVCRRPQIFAYLIEPASEYDEAGPAGGIPLFRQQGKILAIWDCPYVKRLQREIAAYAELCELEPIFKENKA
jgi:Fe-S-cluster containining protein